MNRVGVVVALCLVACGHAVPPCDCATQTAVVCGDDGITYASECWAACRGATVHAAGECARTYDCNDCPFGQETVCGANGITYDGECLASCHGVDVLASGACPYAMHDGSMQCDVDADCVPVAGACGFFACYNQADLPWGPPPCVGCSLPACADRLSPGCFCENHTCVVPMLVAGDACTPSRDLCDPDGELACCPSASGDQCKTQDLMTGACP